MKVVGFVEEVGVYKSLVYVCGAHPTAGHRVGYVFVPPEIDVENRAYSFNVHYGITYEEPYGGEYPIAINQFDEHYLVLGFDCGHHYDKIDKELILNMLESNQLSRSEKKELLSVLEHYGEHFDIKLGEVRTLKFVRKECKKLIKQILKG